MRLVGRRKLAIWFAGVAFGGLGLALAAFLLLRRGPPFGDVRLAVWGMALGFMAAGVFCFVEGAVREVDVLRAIEVGDGNLRLHGSRGVTELALHRFVAVDVVLERSITEGGYDSGQRGVIEVWWLVLTGADGGTWSLVESRDRSRIEEAARRVRPLLAPGGAVPAPPHPLVAEWSDAEGRHVAWAITERMHVVLLSGAISFAASLSFGIALASRHPPVAAVVTGLFGLLGLYALFAWWRRDRAVKVTVRANSLTVTWYRDRARRSAGSSRQLAAGGLAVSLSVDKDRRLMALIATPEHVQAFSRASRGDLGAAMALGTLGVLMNRALLILSMSGLPRDAAARARDALAAMLTS